MPPTPHNAKRKKAGRKRRTTGWTLLTLTLLLAGVWVWSGWKEIYFNAATRRWAQKTVVVYRGELWMTSGAPWRFVGTSNTLHTDPLPPPARWTYWAWGFKSLDTGGFWLGMPLWILPLFFGTSAALLLRSGIVARRRVTANACLKCGYSLAGLSENTPCPECGAAGITAT